MSEFETPRVPFGVLDDRKDKDAFWGCLQISGWVIPPERVKHIEVILDDGLKTQIRPGSVMRPDVAAAFPHIPNAKEGGFGTCIYLGLEEGIHRLVVNAILLNGERLELGKRIVSNSKSCVDDYNKLYSKEITIFNSSVTTPHINSTQLPEINKTQWFSKSQIIHYQETLLKYLIIYVYENIPYYRELFDKLDIDPDEIETIRDLKRIPVLTRELAIKNYNKLINPNLIFGTRLSGGTTGHRLKWAYSREWMDLFGRTLWRGFGWAGLTPDKRVASLYSRVIGEVARDSLIIRDVFDPNTIREDLERVKRFSPQFAYCYSSSAYIVAEYLLRKREHLPLEGVIVTSDQLFPDYKTVIEKAFKCNIFNNYGCNDGGAWGAECSEHIGFHHDIERSIMEFGNDGRLITTDLWNYAMPFIRYENGDVGSWIDTPCKCGREMPLFSITGRINDFLIAPSGKIMSPVSCSSFLRNECFLDVRVIQHNEIDVEIQYIRNPRFNSEECRRAVLQLTSILDDMNFTLNEVNYIRRTSSNKQRVVENKFNSAFDGVI